MYKRCHTFILTYTCRFILTRFNPCWQFRTRGKVRDDGNELCFSSMMDAEVETSEEWKCRVTNSKETRSFVLLFKRFSRLVCRNRAVFAVRVASTARVHRSLFFSTVTLQRSSVWPCWFLEWPHYCFWRSLLISTQTSLEFNYFWVAVFFSSRSSSCILLLSAVTEFRASSPQRSMLPLLLRVILTNCDLENADQVTVTLRLSAIFVIIRKTGHFSCDNFLKIHLCIEGSLKMWKRAKESFIQGM